MPVCNTGGGYTMDFRNTLPQRVFTPATESITVVDTTSSQALSSKTLSANINSDVKVLAATFSATSGTTGTTLTSLTGMSWSVIAGATYRIRFHGTVAMTTNCGLMMALKLTTATLTSIALRARSSTDTDNTGAVSAAFTTTTDQASIIAQNAVAYTNVIIEGTLVVNAAGTIAIQAAQNASHADTTSVLLGAFAQLERVL